MKKLDFDKIDNLATLFRAGMSLKEILAYAEVIETSPNLPKDAGIEEVKEEADKKSVETLPTEKKKEDPIEQLKNLIED